MSTNSPPAAAGSVASVDSVTDGLEKQGSTEDVSVKLKLEDLNWDHSFVRELPGDPRTDTISREVKFQNLTIKKVKERFPPNCSIFVCCVHDRDI